MPSHLCAPHTPVLKPALAPIRHLAARQILLLENVRFYPEEEKNDAEFAKKLAAPADMCARLPRRLTLPRPRPRLQPIQCSFAEEHASMLSRLPHPNCAAMIFSSHELCTATMTSADSSPRAFARQPPPPPPAPPIRASAAT